MAVWEVGRSGVRLVAPLSHSCKTGIPKLPNTARRLHGLNNRRAMSFCSWFKEEHFRDHFEPGVYVCVECSNELFSSRTKYEHNTPWPAFTQTIHENSVSKVPEDGRAGALKVSCGKCGNGLGHEFLKGGPGGDASRF